jgi:hypothetical protein
MTSFNFKRRHGTENPNAKLAEEDIPGIRRDIANGVPLVDIAAKHDISPQIIGRIKKRALWSHVPEEAE